MASRSKSKSFSNQNDLLIKIKKTRTSSKNNTTTQPSSWNQRRKDRKNKLALVRSWGDEMNNAFETAIPDIELMKDVLSYILKEKFGADVYLDKVKQQQILIIYNIACRMEGGSGMANIAYERMMQAFVVYMKYNNMLRVSNPLPGKLYKKMGNLERKGTLPVKYQLVRCATGGGKTEMCVHYWIKQLPLLVDKLTASCIEQCRYEDSIDFSHIKHKNIICLGMDK